MSKLKPTKLIMIRKTDEFSSVFGFRKRFSTPLLVCHCMPNNTINARVGFVVSKKVAKLAVDRNYMRRVLREICRQELYILHGVDVVIQVKKPFKNNQFLLLKQELAMLFVKIQYRIAQETKADA